MTQLNWLITGTSSGLGNDLARASLARGDQVAATFRKQEQAADFSGMAPGRSQGIVMNVTNKASVDVGVGRAAAAMGNRIDVVVNNPRCYSRSKAMAVHERGV